MKMTAILMPASSAASPLSPPLVGATQYTSASMSLILQTIYETNESDLAAGRGLPLIRPLQYVATSLATPEIVSAASAPRQTGDITSIFKSQELTIKSLRARSEKTPLSTFPYNAKLSGTLDYMEKAHLQPLAQQQATGVLTNNSYRQSDYAGYRRKLSSCSGDVDGDCCLGPAPQFLAEPIGLLNGDFQGSSRPFDAYGCGEYSMTRLLRSRLYDISGGVATLANEVGSFDWAFDACTVVGLFTGSLFNWGEWFCDWVGSAIINADPSDFGIGFSPHGYYQVYRSNPSILGNTLTSALTYEYGIDLNRLKYVVSLGLPVMINKAVGVTSLWGSSGPPCWDIFLLGRVCLPAFQVPLMHYVVVQGYGNGYIYWLV
jgi:hypothetical protein